MFNIFNIVVTLQSIVQYSLTKSGHPGGMASKVGERSGLPKVIWSDNCWLFFNKSPPHTECAQSSRRQVRQGLLCPSIQAPGFDALTGHQGGSPWDSSELHCHPWEVAWDNNWTWSKCSQCEGCHGTDHDPAMSPTPGHKLQWFWNDTFCFLPPLPRIQKISY